MKAKVISQWGVNILKSLKNDEEVFNQIGKEVIISEYDSENVYLVIENPTDEEIELFWDWVSLLEKDESGQRSYVRQLNFDMEWFEDEYLAVNIIDEKGKEFCCKCFPDDIVNKCIVLYIWDKRYIEKFN